MKLNRTSIPGGYIRCPKCGYEIPITTGPNSILQVEVPVRRVLPLSTREKIIAGGDAAFLDEAAKQGWSVFHLRTSDVGMDFAVAKEYASVMVQLKTATLMDNGRFHVTIGRFLEGPLSFIVYHFQDIDAFFLIPSAEYWEIPRFKKRKTRVFQSGPYADTMSYEKAKEVMGEYEGEKGWERLEGLTTPDGLLEAVKKFIEKRKKQPSEN